LRSHPRIRRIPCSPSTSTSWAYSPKVLGASATVCTVAGCIPKPTSTRRPIENLFFERCFIDSPDLLGKISYSRAMIARSRRVLAAIACIRLSDSRIKDGTAAPRTRLNTFLKFDFWAPANCFILCATKSTSARESFPLRFVMRSTQISNRARPIRSAPVYAFGPMMLHAARYECLRR